jgi:hypothetical protein
MSLRINWSKDGTILWRSKDNGLSIYNALTQSEMDALDSDPLYNPAGVFNTGQSSNNWLCFNFPQEIEIDKIQIAHGGDDSSIKYIEVSSNSNSGIDGQWTSIWTADYIPESTLIQDVLITNPTPGTWLRMKNWKASVASNHSIYKLLLFGEYTSSRYEFWNISETQQLTEDYPLLLENAPNHTDYTDYEPFKVKNTDSIQHSYEITIQAIRYGGDSLVTDYFTLSEDSGATKVTTITITNLQPGGFTPELRIYADIPSVNNPANGYHYFAIKVVETA